MVTLDLFPSQKVFVDSPSRCKFFYHPDIATGITFAGAAMAVKQLTQGPNLAGCVVGIDRYSLWYAIEQICYMLGTEEHWKFNKSEKHLTLDNDASCRFFTVDQRLFMTGLVFDWLWVDDIEQVSFSDWSFFKSRLRCKEPKYWATGHLDPSQGMWPGFDTWILNKR